MTNFDYTNDGEAAWTQAWDIACEAAGNAWVATWAAARTYGGSPSHSGAMARAAAQEAARQSWIA